MRQSIEQLYQDIATQIVQGIDDKWTSAWITVEVIDQDVFSLNAYYYSEDNEIKRFRIHPFMPQWFMDLRNQIKKDSCKAWTNARFDLQPNGNFALHFDYKDNG